MMMCFPCAFEAADEEEKEEKAEKEREKEEEEEETARRQAEARRRAAAIAEDCEERRAVRSGGRGNEGGGGDGGGGREGRGGGGGGGGGGREGEGRGGGDSVPSYAFVCTSLAPLSLAARSTCCMYMPFTVSLHAGWGLVGRLPPQFGLQHAQLLAQHEQPGDEHGPRWQLAGDL